MQKEIPSIRKTKDKAVRPGKGPRHLPKPIKLRGAGKKAADYVSDGRR